MTSLTSSWSLAQQNLIQRVRLTKGEKAPFDGQLLSNAAAAKILSDLKAQTRLSEEKRRSLVEIYEAKMKFLKKSCQASANIQSSQLEVCLDTHEKSKKLHDKAIKRLNKALAKKNKKPWYKSPYLHLTLITVAVAAGGIAILVSQVD